MSITNNKINNLLAGGIAGVCEISITYPLDYTKTQFQLSNKRSQDFFPFFKHIYKTNGISGFYRGYVPVIIGQFPKTSVRFYSYQYFKDHNTFGNAFVNGFMTGVTEALLVVTPFETIKTKLIHKNADFYTGTKNIIRENGLRGIYQGALPTVLRTATNQASRFGIFQAYSDYILNNRLESDNDNKTANNKLTTIQALSGGIIAGGCSVIVSNPFDVVKTKCQYLVNSLPTKNVIHNIYNTRGIAGFFSGLLPRFLKVVPGQGILFSVYHKVYNYLDD